MKLLFTYLAAIALSQAPLVIYAQSTVTTPIAVPSTASPQFVIFHSPGPQWVAGVSANKQVGIDAHVNHFAQYASAGKIAMGGPFLDNSGGMMVGATGVRLEEIQAIADKDPAVISGLLTFTIRPWLPAVRSATQVVSVDRLPRGSIEDLDKAPGEPEVKKELPRSAGKNAANRGKSSF
ncbi:MAG: hypothetical protein SFY80_13560 [Verrucomicrobiota bacterium]|nr:hypothetical protein [Verrucomicrobiota bacterium]